jgi:hypothetical protein
MLRWFSNSKQLLRASNAAFLTSIRQNSARFLSKSPNNFPKLYKSTLIQKIKIAQIFSQANTSNHYNIFTFILP